jgi:hypothetical protein
MHDGNGRPAFVYTLAAARLFLVLVGYRSRHWLVDCCLMFLANACQVYGIRVQLVASRVGVVGGERPLCVAPRKRAVDTPRPAMGSVHMPEDFPIEDLPTPDPSYGPGEVVSVQLDGLATNDEPFENAGIGVAYNFASPSNRRATGPFDRFVRMVTGPRYAPMVDHVEATPGPVERDDDTAERRVTLTGPDGRTVTSLFTLSRDRPGDLDGCWLTDRVVVD